MQQKHTPQRDGSSDDRATRISGRDRGVSEIIGAILLFGLLIAVLVLVQANAVPDANKQLEFQHNERVHGDFVDLDADIEATAATGNGRVTVIESGLRYPPRFFLFNPPPAEGAIRTTPAKFSVRNAVATNEETEDYWNGDPALADSETRFVYASRAVSYDPAYNVYAGAPTTTYAHGAVINEFDDGTVLTVDDRSFINQNRISLIAVEGERDISQIEPLSIESTSVSPTTRTVEITNAPDEQITIRIETSLTPAQWSEGLSEEMADGNVDTVTSGPDGTVDVTLDPGDYELQMAKVTFDTYDPEPYAYVTAPEPALTTVDPDGTDVTVEVRDRFNNPVPNVDVRFEARDSDGDPVGNFRPSPVPTNENGRATATFSSSVAPGSVTIRAGVDVDGNDDLFDAEADENPEHIIEYQDITVGDGTNPDTSDDINPNAPSEVVLQSATLGEDCQSADTQNQVDVLSPGCTVEVEFENLYSEDRLPEQVRVNFFGVDQSFKTTGQSPFSKRPGPTDVTIGEETMAVSGPYQSVSLSVIPTGEPSTYSIEFFHQGETAETTGTYNVVEGDYFLLSVIYDNGKRSVYWVGPVAPDDQQDDGNQNPGQGNN